MPSINRICFRSAWPLIGMITLDLILRAVVKKIEKFKNRIQVTFCNSKIQFLRLQS